jgi:hypothetical protein
MSHRKEVQRKAAAMLRIFLHLRIASGKRRTGRRAYHSFLFLIDTNLNEANEPSASAKNSIYRISKPSFRN